jgi:hypothetical protein
MAGGSRAGDLSLVAAAVVVTRYHRAPPVGAFADHLACAECHVTEWRQWAQSHHAKAMQVADDTTVVGDFRDARFGQFGTASRFFRRDGKFLVSPDGHDGGPRSSRSSTPSACTRSSSTWLRSRAAGCRA